MEAILFEIIDEQTSLLAYETYVRSCIKKDTLKQKNKIVNKVVRDLCREVATEVQEEFAKDDKQAIGQTQAPVAADVPLESRSVNSKSK